MLERIKRFTLYGDTDRASYNTIKGRIEDANRFTALIFASVAAILIFVMYLLSFKQEGFSSSRAVYIFGIVFSLLQLVVALASKKRPGLTYVSVYMAISVFLIYGITIATLTRPEEQTVTFMVMLIFVPLIFLDRPIRMAANLLFYIVVFIIAAEKTKTDPVLTVDVTDAVIFGALAIVSEMVVYRAKIKGYVLENRLHIMSETDQLTGLNNRNSYEWRLGTYPELYSRSICCIYIDVNGLHEMNNSQGHKAGDEMLCCVAGIVKEQFGSKDTYRVGGDEYVAFCLDTPLESVEKHIEEMKAQIIGQGYHVAVGYEFSGDQQTDIHHLIRCAESKMYQDKSEYYKQHDRRAR